MTDLFEINKDCEASTDDFWYDLFDGGCLNPRAILKDENDILDVENAIKVLLKYRKSCEQIEGFYF